MSLSRIFKDKSSFKPEKLVTSGSDSADHWEQVALAKSIDEKTVNKATPQTYTKQNITPDPQPRNNSMPIEDDLDGDGSTENQHINTASETNENFIPPEPPSSPPPDIDKIKEEAFSLGIQEGIRQVESDFGSGLAALTQACDQLNVVRETILKNSKAEIIDLIITLSEKIIRHSVTQQDKTIINTVEEALNKAVRSSEFYIYLNPEDIEIIESRSQEFISGVNGLEHIVIKPDPAIGRGGCKVESENCTVDATLAGQLAVIQEEIKKQV